MVKMTPYIALPNYKYGDLRLSMIKKLAILKYKILREMKTIVRVYYDTNDYYFQIKNDIFVFRMIKIPIVRKNSLDYLPGGILPLLVVIDDLLKKFTDSGEIENIYTKQLIRTEFWRLHLFLKDAEQNGYWISPSITTGITTGITIEYHSMSNDIKIPNYITMLKSDAGDIRYI